MPNEKLTLSIVGQASGQADIDRLVESFNKYVSAVEGGAKRIKDANQQQASSAQSTSSTIKNAFSDPVSAATSATESFVHSFGKVGGVVTGVVGGLVAAGTGLVLLTKQYGDIAKEQQNFADRLGLTIGQSQKFGAVARLAGVDAGSLETATRTMAIALEDGAGKGAKGAAALARLGISTHELNGESRELGQVMLEVVEALSKVENTTTRTALATQLLGRFSKEIQPAIKNYQDYKKAVEELGIGLDASGTQQLVKFRDEVTKVEIAFGELKRRLAVKVEPIIIPIVHEITEIFTGKKTKEQEEREKDPFGWPSVIHSLTHPLGPNSYLGAISRYTQEQNHPNQPVIDSLLQNRTGFNPAANALRQDLGARTQQDLSAGDQARIAYLPTLQKSEEFVKAQLDKTKEEIRKSIDTISAGGASGGVGGVAVADAQAVLASAQAREKTLQLNLKLIENEKAATEDLIKTRERVLAQSGLGPLAAKYPQFVPDPSLVAKGILPPGAGLPAQKEFVDFATKPGVDASQVAEKARLLGPRLAEEQQAVKLRAQGLSQNFGQTEVEKFAASLGITPEQATASGLLGRVEDKRSFGEIAAQQQKDRDTAYAFSLSRKNEAVKDINELNPVLLSTVATDRATREQKALGAAQLSATINPTDEAQQALRVAGIKKGALEETYQFERELIERTESDATLQEAKLTELRVKNAQDVAAIQIEAVQRVAELERQRVDEFKSTFADLILSAQNHNIGSFIKSQGENIERTVLQNAAGLAVKNGLKIPSITDDPNSVLGQLFKGTLAGADPVKSAGLTLNTAGTSLISAGLNLNQAAVNLLAVTGGTPASGTGLVANGTAAIGGISGVGLSGLGPLASIGAFGSDTNGLTGNGPLIPGGIGPSGVLGSLLGGLTSQTVSAKDPLSFLSTLPGAATLSGVLTGASTVIGGDSIRGAITGAVSVPGGGVQGLSPAEQVGAGIGAASTAYAGVSTAVKDFSRGGARGIVGGIGTLAGTAAVLDPEPISKGILAGVALVSSIITGVLGDPKQLRATAIDKEIAINQHPLPTALDLSFDERGFANDRDASGGVRRSTTSNFPVNVRQPAIYRYAGGFIDTPGADLGPFDPNRPAGYVAPSGGTPAPNVTVNVTAMDSKSFLDHSDDIASAARVAMQQGHPINQEMQRVINP